MLRRQTLVPKLWKLAIPLACTPLLVALLVMIGGGTAAAQSEAPLAPVTIPFSTQTPKIDGACNRETEYASALVQNFLDFNDFNATVLLQADNANLYVCMIGAASDVALPGRHATVYLDTDNGQESEAQAEDLGLQVGFVVGASGPMTPTRGDGVGGYTVDPTIIGWDAKSSSTPNVDVAEWKIPLELISLNLCSGTFGISVFHQTVQVFGWPAGAVSNSPKTWAEAGLAGLDCSDLSVIKSGPQDPVPLGAQFTYTVEVTNNSKSAANNVVVTDTLPAGVAYIGYAAPGAVVCSEASGLVTCTIPAIPPNGKVVIQIFVRGTTVGTVTNKVQVSIPGTLDVTPGDNTDVVRTAIEGVSGKLAYVFRLDDVTANNFKTFLESRGFTVQLVPLPVVLATDFSVFDAILIADDTGDLDEWPLGTPGVSAESDHINSYNKPTIGLGEGGYAYFGKQGKSIGWPNGWHGPLDTVTGINPGMTYWQVPTPFAIPGVVQLYTNPVNEVGIFFPPLVDVVPLGVEPTGTADHAPLITDKQDCDQLWGFSGRPAGMTADGKNVLVNAVVFALGRQCTPPPPPTAQECVELIKTAVPPDGTPVQPGDNIIYTVHYEVKDSPNCRVFEAALEDPVPTHTIFVPGSASDGIAPGGDGVLRWPLGNLNPGDSGDKKFTVYVTHAACREQRVRNQARLTGSLGVFTSNIVQHPVECPPVVPDDPGNPPYAEEEIQIYPYPLVTGQPTEVSVRVRNLVNTTQTVTVTFQTAPQNFGIGLNFTTNTTVANNPRVVILPPLGVVEVKWQWSPTTSGHYCVSIKIEGAGQPPIFTYRNLDVQEDLRPDVTDVLSFTVRNPKPTTEDIVLVVDNTCPGWAASVSPALLANMAPNDIREAALSVTPPNMPLGTACHIDVQGWIGGELIGGIRKLDVPPVHLPPANPPWNEKEIVAIPDPPVAGQPGQLCIQLNNPLLIPRTVNIQFSEADFGAGIPFTPIGGPINRNVLPGLNQFCIPWTPATGGTTHRCILVTLSQAGFHDQHSQRNIDIHRLTIGSLRELLDLEIEFFIGNTAEFTRPLVISPTLVGLGPIIPQFTPDPPPELGPGQQIKLTLGLLLPAAAAAEGNGVTAAPDDPLTIYGDVARVEIAAFLDGEQAGGVSVEFVLPAEEQEKLFLPAVNKK